MTVLEIYKNRLLFMVKACAALFQTEYVFPFTFVCLGNNWRVKCWIRHDSNMRNRSSIHLDLLL